VVFAITSAEQPDWALMFGNLRNLGKGMPGVRMEVVVYGPAVGLLRRGSAVAADVEALEQQGVAFVACENSLHHMDLAAAELLAGVGTVPSGIVEVVRRQQEGWAYIKAGR
jgi:intracellular sulfur oxidation DsrE/DsrF family protein